MKACPFCGEQIQEIAVKCRYCGEWLSKTGKDGQKEDQHLPTTRMDTISSSAGTMTVPSRNVEYAGFWRRLCAYTIDILLITIAQILLGMGWLLLGIVKPENAEVQLAGAGLLLGWLYFAGMESSEKQSTIGKRAMGIIVTDAQGDKVSFGRASGRHFARVISAIILCIGFIMAGLTKKKQALHDIMSGCLVVMNRETWGARHYKGLSALLASIPVIGIIAAIAIPGYLGMQERARKAQVQNEQVQAPAQGKGDIFDQRNPSPGNTGQSPATDQQAHVDWSQYTPVSPAPQGRDVIGDYDPAAPAYMGTWRAVRLLITDKGLNTTSPLTCGIYETCPIKDSSLRVSVKTFLPHFKMDGGIITSASNESVNPAARVEILENGTVVFQGWLYALYPDLYPFSHPRYAVTLKEGLK